MEKSNIKNMDKNYLSSLGFKNAQIQKISDLVNRGINEKLYYHNYVPYHDISHIERVLCYSILILNMKEEKGEILKNTDILLYAALYHDCGRKLNVSNKSHGIMGAKIALEKLKEMFDDKTLLVIKLLIETHAKKDDLIDFEKCEFSYEEKDNIQMLSNILKDADALDRNRIKLFKFAQCKPEYLRTDEAKEIYIMSNNFLESYEKTR